MRVWRILVVTLAALLATACRSAARPAAGAASGYTSSGYEAFGLPLESIDCLEFEWAPRPEHASLALSGELELVLVGYKSDYHQRDSVAGRRELQRRMDAAGYEARRTRQATRGSWVLVIPVFRGTAPSCENLGARRASGLLFERPERDQ